MTVEESRGRRITVVIALVVGAPPLLVLALLLATHQPVPWIQVVLPVILAVLLYKGYSWARAYIIFSLCAGALFLLLSPLRATDPIMAISTAIVSLPFAAAYVGAAIILWRSKAVEAYFDRQTHSRDALLSLKNQDGA